MKNKSVTYALIAGVLLVWGLIGYRIISGLTKEEEMPGNGLPVAHLSPENTKSDTFELILDYRDPFLGNAVARPAAVSSTHGPARKKALQGVAPVVVDWSFVSYHGTIRNSKSGKQISILKLRGNEVMVSANEKLGDVRILKVSRDSVLVEHLGAKKWIFKSY